MKPLSFLLLLIIFFVAKIDSVAVAQTYYYEGGSISANDLRRARPYKQGTFLLQGGQHRGIIWIPQHDARGSRFLELLLEHFLQGNEIRDYTPVQIETVIGGSHGTVSVLSLLMDVDARKLLNVREAQGEKINALFVDFRTKIADRMKEFQKSNPNASELKKVLFRTAEMERLSPILQERLNSILPEKQYRAAQETVFQLYGGFDTPVVDIDLLTVFALSKEQREKLERIAEDANEKRNKVFEAKSNARLAAADYQSFDRAMGEVTFIVSRKVRETLTKEQLQKGEALMKQAENIKKQLGLDSR